ncbi:GntR-family transcriptional regulator, partial [Streptomyces clavuligerus]
MPSDRSYRCPDALPPASSPPSAASVPGGLPGSAAPLLSLPGQGRGGQRYAHGCDEPPGPGPRAVRRHSVRGQVLQALRAALADGGLTPGEIYSAPALGERFGVSATPVREAMQQLAAEGAVETVPNRGFRVVARGARERAELAEVRALVEIPVVLRLARTVPAGEWHGLRPLAEATVAAAADGDRARYAETDRAFHRALLSLGGNAQLVAVADDLHRRAQGPRTPRAALTADAAQHLALLDALASEDHLALPVLLQAHFDPEDPPEELLRGTVGACHPD